VEGGRTKEKEDRKRIPGGEEGRSGQGLRRATKRFDSRVLVKTRKIRKSVAGWARKRQLQKKKANEGMAWKVRRGSSQYRI